MSSIQKFPWKRFWTPVEGVNSLIDDGFLLDPDDGANIWFQNDAVPFDQIDKYPCLALLGEPGIGKSTVVKEISDELGNKIHNSGDQIFYLNLNEFGDENRLLSSIFETEIFKSWRKGNYALNLYLDSLDECKIKIGRIGLLLSNKLKELGENFKRLKIRIVSRTADWPKTLENGLHDIWGNDFKTYELAPLRKKDARLAAMKCGLNEDGFLHYVISSQSVPFAIKPVTLKFLLSTYSNHRFSKSRQELFEKGCEKLCQEENPCRIDSINSGELNEIEVSDKICIASRIAAIMLFCKKSVIDTSFTSTSENSDELTIAEICGQAEFKDSNEVYFTRDQIKNTLNTGLFSSRGSEKIGFAHQTYAEYLASQYLRTCSISSDKLISILTHSLENESEFVPQLQEVIAWVADWNNDIFAYAAERDPLILLRGDKDSWSTEQKEVLVEKILSGVENNRFISSYKNDWSYEKLQHVKLSEQLKPFITGVVNNERTRELAINIAAVCKQTELSQLILGLALDSSQQFSLRKAATMAISEMGDVESRKALLPLAIGDVNADPMEELKGYALQALWPGCVSKNQVFKYLTVPAKPNFTGKYKMFLIYEIHPHLQANDIPFALDWVKNIFASGRLDYSLRCLSEKIILKSIDNLGNNEILEKLVELWVALDRECISLVTDTHLKKKCIDILENSEIRNRFVTAFIQKADSNSHLSNIIFEWPNFLRSEDFLWTIEQLRKSIGNIRIEENWARSLKMLFRHHPEKQNLIGAMDEARKIGVILRDITAADFEPVVLNSEKAQALRAEYEEEMAYIRERDRRMAARRDVERHCPQEQVRMCLAHFAAGEKDIWFNILREIFYNQEHQEFYVDSWLNNENINTLIWLSLEPDVQNEIIATAKSYIEELPLNNACVGANRSIYHTGIAGFRAMQLIHSKEPNFVSNLSKEVLAFWLQPMWFFFDMEIFREIATRLLLVVKNKVPEEFEIELISLINTKLSARQLYSARQLINCFWSENVANQLYETLLACREDTCRWKEIAGALISHNHAKAHDKILEIFQQSYTDEHKELIVKSSLVIALNGGQSERCFLLNRIENENGFARDFIVELCDEIHDNFAAFSRNLDCEEILNLYIWLEKNFPHETDPERDGAYTPTSDDGVREFRDHLFRKIAGAGTIDSHRSLLRIAKEFPNFKYMLDVIDESRKRLFANSWTPLFPKEFLQLVSNPKTRAIRNASELQRLLMDILDQIQKDMMGETPSVAEVWNELPNPKEERKKTRPKEENQFSDWLKRRIESYLKLTPVVVCREVEIRPRLGNESGQETDLLVLSSTLDPASGEFNEIKIIIEVKGCWNSELKTAMETQLLDRYLKNNRCQNGIYIVGWFMCEAWDQEDWRKSATPKFTLDDAREFFSKQASKLSVDEGKIESFVFNAAYGS